MNPTNEIFQGLSILLLSEDDARAKALSKALRDQRARVGDLGISAREGVRGIDLAVVDARSELSCAAQLAALRTDVRGRWASVVTIDYKQLVKGDGSVLLNGLAERVAPLVEADRALTEQALSESTFKTSLAPLGPPRTLRALSLSGHTLFVELHAKTLDAVIEVSNELLVSASATRGDKRWEAWSALVRILGLNECELTVSRRSFTSFMNIMEPVDQALEVAAQERACSADQIAREEAEAEARSPGSHALPARVAAAAPAQPPPPPAAAGITPPRPAPPGRPVGSLGHQRTLMGVVPGLPSPGIAANDVRAIAAKQPPEPPPPRYAHRHTDAREQGMPPPPAPSMARKASMTLMGVAPSAIPGLAEMRAQRTAKKHSEPAVDPRVAQREELKKALNEEPNFDPPTVRHNLGNLPDLAAALPDFDDLARAARPLSSPLPPPASERDDEREPPTQPGMSFDDLDDSNDQTMITPSALTEELLARAIEGAATERPPPARPSIAVDTVPAPPREIVELRPSAAQSLPASGPPEPFEHADVIPNSEPPAPGVDSYASHDQNVGEETLVVNRKPEKPKSRSGLIGALAALAAVLALVSYVAMRSGRQVPAAEQATVEAQNVPAKPAPSALKPAPVPALEPKPEPAVANEALVPLADAAVAEPLDKAAPIEAAPSEKPSEKPAFEPALIEKAPIEKPAFEPALIEKAPSEKPAIKQTPSEKPSEKPAIEPAPPAGGTSAPIELTAPAGNSATADPADAPTTPVADQVNELVKRGQRLLAQHDAAGARPVLEEAVALQADNPHAHASLAAALLRLNELPLALVQAQTAVKLRPKRGHYLVVQGNVLAAMGKADDAHAAFQRAYELDPNDAEAKRKAGF